MELTSKNVFETALKLGAGFGAYMTAGSVLQVANTGDLFKYSIYASLSGNGAAWILDSCKSSQEPIPVESAIKTTQFILRYAGGILPFAVYYARSEGNLPVYQIVGCAFPFLLAYEVASELLANYLRCCPGREVLPPNSSIQEDDSRNLSNHSDGEDPLGGSESCELRSQEFKATDPKRGYQSLLGSE